MIVLNTERWTGGELPHHEEKDHGLWTRRPGRRLFLRTAAVLAGGVVAAMSRRVGAEDCAQPVRTPILGPYYLDGPEERNDTGDGIVVRGKVLSADCQPIAGAVVVRWHANTLGVYEEYYRASMPVKDDGSFEMSTIKPGKYSNLDRHIHWYVTAPGHVPVIAQLQWTDDQEIEGEATFDFSMEKG